MRRWLPLLAICLGTFMLLLDVTIVNVALPAMAVDLGTTFSSLQWVIDVYALVLAALLLSAGSLSDVIGRRVVYLSGLILFALASLASGAAPNAAVLITARAIQGVGAAAMFATTVALINATYHRQDRGIAYGVWGAVSGAAAATGPIIGGLLTQHLSWRWIFLVNVPVSVVAVALTIAVLEGGRGEHRHRFDPVGAVTFTGFAALLTYAFVRAGDDGWLSGSTLLLIAIGLLLLAAFIAFELRTAEPMLDLHLFRDRRFTGVMLVALSLSTAAFSYLAYSSIWLESVLSLSPVETGLVYLPLSLASFAVSAGIGRKLHGVEPRWIVGGGMLLIGIGALAQARLGADSRWPSLLIGLLVVGIGVGLANPTMTSAVMATVPPQRGGMASGAMNTLRQLGFAFGIAVLGTVMQSRIGHLLESRHPGTGKYAAAVSGGQTQAILHAVPAGERAAVSAAIHSAFASGLNLIFLVSGIFGVVVGLLALFLMRPVRGTVESEPVGVPEAVTG